MSRFSSYRIPAHHGHPFGQSEQTAKTNEVPANNLFNMFETMKEVLTQERYKDKSIMTYSNAGSPAAFIGIKNKNINIFINTYFKFWINNRFNIKSNDWW